jgi:hypothetical protein
MMAKKAGPDVREGGRAGFNQDEAFRPIPK